MAGKLLPAKKKNRAARVAQTVRKSLTPTRQWLGTPATTLLLMIYSARNATIGSSNAALRAGNMPDRMPITPETTTATITAAIER